MNGLSSLDKSYNVYSLAPTEYLIKFWRLKVKGQGHSRPSMWQRHPLRR